MGRVVRKTYRIDWLGSDGVEHADDILCRSLRQARAYVRRSGGTIISIDAPRPPTWAVDSEALEDAARLLRLKWRIHITRTSSRAHHGSHRLHIKRGWRTPAHYITVEKVSSVLESSRILWHELCHAAQAERTAAHLPPGATPSEMNDAWGSVLLCEREDTFTYANRGTEVEAKSYENAAAHMPLTKEL